MATYALMLIKLCIEYFIYEIFITTNQAQFFWRKDERHTVSTQLCVR
jgi:hypothetical protein